MKEGPQMRISGHYGPCPASGSNITAQAHPYYCPCPPTSDYLLTVYPALFFLVWFFFSFVLWSQALINEFLDSNYELYPMFYVSSMETSVEFLIPTSYTFCSLSMSVCPYKIFSMIFFSLHLCL